MSLIIGLNVLRKTTAVDGGGRRTEERAEESPGSGRERKERFGTRFTTFSFFNLQQH